MREVVLPATKDKRNRLLFTLWVENNTIAGTPYYGTGASSTTMSSETVTIAGKGQTPLLASCLGYTVLRAAVISEHFDYLDLSSWPRV